MLKMNANLQLKRIQNLVSTCGSHEILVKQILAQCTVLGFLNFQHLACKLLNVYGKLNKPVDAHHVFDQIPNPDIISWTSLFNLYLNNQQPVKTLFLFSEFITTASSIKPDPHALVAAISASGRSHNLKAGKIVHAMVYRRLFEPELLVGNSLIDMYSRSGYMDCAKRVFHSMDFKDVATWTSLLNGHVLCGDIESSQQVFDNMPLRNIVSWSAMIVGYVRSKKPVRALELFWKMRSEGKDNPASITIVAVLSGCADIGALDFGMLIHGYMYKATGLAMDVAVNNALIDMYAKSGNLDDASNVFIRIIYKDSFSWTSMISAFAFHGKGNRALEFFNDMVESRMSPNEITFLSLLSACVHAGLVHEGRIVFKKMLLSRNIEPTIEHYGCMVDLLGRARCFTDALDLIKNMPMKPDSVIWRSLLHACLRHGGNIDLAEIAGKKILELEPDDDGVYVLLWNLYRAENRWEDASRVSKMMKVQRIKKAPGCSWVELNGVVHEFLADGHIHVLDDDICQVLERVALQDKWDYDDELG